MRLTYTPEPQAYRFDNGQIEERGLDGWSPITVGRARQLCAFFRVQGLAALDVIAGAFCREVFVELHDAVRAARRPA